MRLVDLWTVESWGNPPIVLRTMREAMLIAAYLRDRGERAVRIIMEMVVAA